MIYLNYNSTAPLSDQARKEMLPFLSGLVGNPSEQLLAVGQEARRQIDRSRSDIAQLLGSKEQEVVFTSGGSESCFLALSGVVAAGIRRIVISGIEHPAVSEAAKWLQRVAEIELEVVPVRSDEGVCWSKLETTLSAGKPGLISFMQANNETGDLLPLEEIVSLAKRHDWLIHSDCTQAVGKCDVSFSKLGVDLLSMSAHKISGPRGIGALLIKEGTKFDSPLFSGGQQAGRRGGTEPIAEVVGFAAAARFAKDSLAQGLADKVEKLRDQFETTILKRVDGASINRVASWRRLCNTSNIFLPGVVSFDLVRCLAERGIIVSAGSACESSQLKPSKVLMALGKSSAASLSSIRVSLGAETTKEEIEQAAEILVEEAQKRRTRIEQELNARVINV